MNKDIESVRIDRYHQMHCYLTQQEAQIYQQALKKKKPDEMNPNKRIYKGLYNPGS